MKKLMNDYYKKFDKIEGITGMNSAGYRKIVRINGQYNIFLDTGEIITEDDRIKKIPELVKEYRDYLMVNNYNVCEIVRDFDNSYYINLSLKGDYIFGIKEYVDYRTLRKSVKEQTGLELPLLKELQFERFGRKSYARIF